MQKVYYYSDPVNDDFAGTKIKTIKTPANYKYIHTSKIYKIIRSFIYHIIAKPVVTIYVKLVFRHKFVNKKIVKKYKKTGYFIYGNHTNVVGDAFIPNILTYPKRNFIIVNPDATSIKGLRTIVSMLGGLPVPSGLKSAKNFKHAINTLVKENNSITIFPEAHIWPYYTDIRPFPNVSFSYPYEENVPVFTLTTVYIKRRFIKLPKIISYVDGPFYADQSIDKKDSIQKLRDEVFNNMINNVNKHPKYEYVKYIYKEKERIME